MKVGLVTWVTPNLEVFNSLTYSNKKAYCDKHGYDYIVCRDTEQSLRNIVPNMGIKALFWYKLIVLLKYVDFYDLLMWQDIDSLIMNDSTTIESFIKSDEYAMYLSGIETAINKHPYVVRSDLSKALGNFAIGSGCLIVKNSDITKQILNLLLTSTLFTKYSIDRPHEEGALTELAHSNFFGLKKYIYVYPCFKLQSWLPVPVLDTHINNPIEPVYKSIPFKYYNPLKRHRFLKFRALYEVGDFLLHVCYPGTMHEKVEFMKYILSNINEFKIMENINEQKVN